MSKYSYKKKRYFQPKQLGFLIKTTKNVNFGCTEAIEIKNKEISIQEFNFDRSICMVAIVYSDAILAVPTNELLGGERSSAKFQIDIPKTEGN